MLFALEEYENRLARARAALSDAGLVGALCVSPESITYFTGYNGYTHWTEQALIISVDSASVTLVLRQIDLTLAAESSWVSDVRSYEFGRESACAVVRDAVKTSGMASGSLGLEKQSHAMPAIYADALADALPDSFDLVDCSILLSRLRVRKTAAELVYVRQAAEITRAGMQAAVDCLRPGISEIDAAATIELALRRAGSDYSAMPTMLASGPRTAGIHSTPTDRILKPGEPVSLLLAGVRHRYHVTAYRTVHLGKPPARFRELYLVAQQALAGLGDAVVIGRPVAEAARLAASSLRPSGCERYHVARWGYGVGMAYPPVWLEAFDIVEESSDVFQPDTVMCLHICFSVPDEKFGLVVGHDVILTDSGVERLDHLGTGLSVLTGAESEISNLQEA